VATIFNFLGPLANPAQPPAQAVGVADARMAGVMASVLAARGTSALVFRGEDGLDELTVTGPSRVWEVREGSVTESTVTPEALGVSRAPIESLRGEDAAYNAKVAQRVLGGEAGAVRDAVLLNASAALVALDAVTTAPSASLEERLRAGVVRAGEAVDSGAAASTLDTWAAVSQRLAAE